MILQALTAYYEDLARSGKIARQGWGKSRISYALELGEGGEVCRVIPLETADEKGKPKPREMELPAPVKRTVGVASNFLWDNGSYLLGHEGCGQGQPGRKVLRSGEGVASFSAVRQPGPLRSGHLPVL